MNPGLRRTAGYVLIFIALAGMLLGGYGIVQIWRWRLPVTQAVQGNLLLAKDMLKTADDLLLLVKDSIVKASDEVDILLETFTNLTDMLKDANPLLESLQTLTGESLPATLKTTQISLETAESSAEIMDNLLRAVSAIPFFPGEPYNPKVPLSTSLKEISKSLDSVTPSLVNIEKSLTTSQENLSAVNTDIIHITANTRQIQQNLKKALVYLQETSNQVQSAQARVEVAQRDAPGWINRLVWAGILAITWISFAQISLLVQGINLIRG